MIWTGRNDGEDALHQRIFQRVLTDLNYENLQPGQFALHGFAVDEGVRRNKGRVGAASAPDRIRSAAANFPVVSPDFLLADFGNIRCENRNLEEAQANFAACVRRVLSQGARSVGFGGGHEIAFAHYSGIKSAFPEERVGIVNIDAHFDNREPEPGVGASSGTGFWQIAQQGRMHSLHIGIQRNSNTLKLFDTAHNFGMNYILADELFFENLPNIYRKIDEFLAGVDCLYLTLCMDVFNAGIAPGVSALAYNGIFVDAAFMHFFRHILKSGKMVAMDVAEVNPEYDIDGRTARLAASLINEWFLAV